MRRALSVAGCLFVLGLACVGKAQLPLTHGGLGAPGAAGGCSDSTTDTWAAAVVTNGGTVSAGRKTLVCNLISGLKSDSVWTKLDQLWIFAAENAASALTDMVATSLAVAHGSPSFTADRGYTGVDASGTVYIDTGFDLTNGGQQFAQNSGHISFWSTTNKGQSSGAGGAAMGVSNGGATSSTSIWPSYADSNGYFYVNENEATSTGVSNANSSGHYVASRTGASTRVVYRNATSILSESIASAGPASGNVFVFVKDCNGAAASGSNLESAAASIGSGLTGTDVTNLYNRLRTYMTAVGVP